MLGLCKTNYFSRVGRLMAIDYGTKRTGLAVTDPLQIIATGLETVSTSDAVVYIKNYSAKEKIDAFIVGIPLHLNNMDAAIVPLIRQFIAKLKEQIPNVEVHEVDERFTSKIAQRSMIESGQNKKTRRNKSLLDKISATIILQSWLEQLKK